MVNKYLALKGKKFDISKVTVVGSPNITSDGVASGFSSSNKIYSKVCDGFDLSAHTYTLKLHLPKARRNVAISGVPFRLLGTWVQLGAGGFVSLHGAGVSSNVTLGLTGNAFADGDDIDLIIQWKYNNYSVRMSVNGGEYGDFTQTGNTLGAQSSTNMQELYLGSNANYSPYQDEIPLTSVEFYIDNQLIYTPTKPTYLIERRKPKVWNKGQFTIVGNPSISDDGVASGFSSGNLLGVNIPVLSVDTLFGVTIEVDCRNSSGSGWLFKSENGATKFCIWTDSGAKNFSFHFAGLGITSINVSYDSVYRILFSRTGQDTYHIKIEDIIEGVVIKDAVYTTTTPTFTPTNGYLNIGASASTSTPLNVSINLKSFKIYTDNNLVFDGGADTYVYDPSKFTIVGSPTITEYGVASGFTTDNYIKTSGFNIGQLKGKSWEIKCKWYFDVNTTDTYDVNDILNLSETYHSQGFMGSNTNIKTLRIMITTGVTGASQIFYQDSLPITESGWVEQKLTFDFNTGTYTFYNLKPNSTTWESREWVATTENKELLVINERPSDCFQIGRGKDTIIGYNPVILPSISTTVDGKEVFTGAKENYYMLNGI